MRGRAVSPAGAPARPRRPAGGLAALVGGVVVGCGAVALALRFVDSSAVPVVVVQSALPVAGALTAAATLLLAALRRPRAALAGLLVMAGYAAVGLPAVVRHTVPPSDDDLVVVATNLQYGQGDPEDVMAEVRRRDADVVVLVEVTPEALAALDRAGLSGWPGQAGAPAARAGGLVVRTRLPVTPIDWGTGDPGPWAAATGRVSTPAGPVVVRGLHPNAPNLRDATRWRAAMADLRDWATRRHRDEPVLMAGDVNSGWGHPAFRELAQGFTDAHRATGAGWVRTWPVTGRVPAFTQLDHVLVRGLDVVDAGTFPVRGTDHAGVWARVHRR